MPDTYDHGIWCPHRLARRRQSPGRRLLKRLSETNKEQMDVRQTFVKVRVGHDAHRGLLAGRVETGGGRRGQRQRRAPSHHCPEWSLRDVSRFHFHA